jgi:hypothetical protein
VALTIKPLFGFGQGLNYSCSGLPSGATCTFSPGSADSETLTIQTTAAAARVDSIFFNHSGALSCAFLFPGFVLFLSPMGNRKSCLHGLRLLSLIAVITVCTLCMSACAGLSSGSTTLSTSVGKSSVTITAATTGTKALSHNVTLSLTVQ